METRICELECEKLVEIGDNSVESTNPPNFSPFLINRG